MTKKTTSTDAASTDGEVITQNTNELATGPVPMQEPEGGWPADEFTGLGGSYVRDPFTGIRRKAE